jgi:hypothetical protein
LARVEIVDAGRLGRLLKISRGWIGFGFFLLSRSFLKSTINAPVYLASFASRIVSRRLTPPDHFRQAIL